MTVELIQGLLLAFALVVILMPPYIRLLHAVGFGKHIRHDGPESHYPKEGTPTMGGLLVVAVVIAIYLLLRGAPDAATFAPLAALAGVGALGAFDDYLNARTGEGIRARQKLMWLTVVAIVAAWQIQNTYAITAIAVPFVGPVSINPWVYVAFAAFAIVASANGVNITDGLDGLSGGTVAICYVAYMLIALLNVPAQPNLALLCALIIGALLGLPVVQRPPGPDLHRRFGGARARCDACGDRADHGPDPRPAADRDHLRGGDDVGHPPDRLLQADRRSAALPDEPDPPPLRAGRLGRGEDHDPVLDHRHPRGAARRDPVPRVAQPAGMRTDSMTEPLDLDALRLDDVLAGALSGRHATVLGLARSGLALTRFLADAGARVTVYDGRPARELGDAIAALGERDVTLALGPERRRRRDVGRR